MINPHTLVGETLAPWNDNPVFGCADESAQLHRVVRIEDITCTRRVARVVGASGVTASGVTMIAGASIRAALTRSASANRSPGVAVGNSGVRETMVSPGIGKLADDLLAGSTTRGAGDVRVTREEAA